MNLNDRSHPDRWILWQALPPEQQRRLLARMADMALRRWKAQRILNTPRPTPEGGDDED